MSEQGKKLLRRDRGHSVSVVLSRMANAAMGVVRAAIRGAVADPTGPDALLLLEQGLSVIRPVLDQLDA